MTKKVTKKLIKSDQKVIHENKQKKNKKYLAIKMEKENNNNTL